MVLSERALNLDDAKRHRIEIFAAPQKSRHGCQIERSVAYGSRRATHTPMRILIDVKLAHVVD
jgi:hypothetical protein